MGRGNCNGRISNNCRARHRIRGLAATVIHVTAELPIARMNRLNVHDVLVLVQAFLSPLPPFGWRFPLQMCHSHRFSLRLWIDPFSFRIADPRFLLSVVLREDWCEFNRSRSFRRGRFSNVGASSSQSSIESIRSLLGCGWPSKMVANSLGVGFH